MNQVPCNGLMAHRLSRENQHQLGYNWTPADRKDRQHINTFACASLNAQIHLCTYLYYIYISMSFLYPTFAHTFCKFTAFSSLKKIANPDRRPTHTILHIYPHHGVMIFHPFTALAMLGDRADATGVEAIFRLSGPQEGRCSTPACHSQTS